MMMMIKFLVFSLIVISPISINGDEDTMVTECSYAKVPSICMQCLESNTNSGTADAAGIAGIVIDCLGLDLVSLNDIVAQLLSSEDGAIKTALEDCSKDFYDAFGIVQKAKKDMENHDYKNAGLWVTLALDSPMKCQKSLQNVNFQSDDVSSQINDYAQLSEAVSRMIDRL